MVPDRDGAARGGSGSGGHEHGGVVLQSDLGHVPGAAVPTGSDHASYAVGVELQRFGANEMVPVGGRVAPHTHALGGLGWDGVDRAKHPGHVSGDGLVVERFWRTELGDHPRLEHDRPIGHGKGIFGAVGDPQGRGTARAEEAQDVVAQGAP